jgi:transposase
MANAMGRRIAPLVLSADERAYLERQVRRHRAARSFSERCRVILRCADGGPSKSVARELGVHEHTVGKWRRRFLKDRIEGLLDEARPGRPRTIDDDQVAAVIERTLRSTPKDATHWSIRSMATETGFSHTTIRRIWKAFGLQPHRSETFKLSSDPLFVDKVRDIVGLYLSPPNRALVLSVDEKSQIQALDRGAAGPAHDAGRPRAPDSLLCPPWYNIAVRGPRYRVRFCDRQMLQAPSSCGVPGLLEASRRARS